MLLPRWGSYQATQHQYHGAPLYIFSSTIPLHLCPGRLLQSYLRNLANMVNRVAKTIKVLTLRLQDNVCSQRGTMVAIRFQCLCSFFAHLCTLYPSVSLCCLSRIQLSVQKVQIQAIFNYPAPYKKSLFADIASLHSCHQF